MKLYTPRLQSSLHYSNTMKKHIFLLLTVFLSCISMWSQPKDLAIRTNLLYDACLTPNVGVEMNVGKGFTVGMNGMYAWWSKESQHKYWRVWGGDIYGRWWFGKKAQQETFLGHHVGVYAGAITYDIKLKESGTGQIAYPFNWHMGAEYGYSFRLANRLRLDCSLGLGYMGGQYKTYESLPVSSFTDEYHKVWKETLQRKYWGPTKAEISLVYVLDFKKKGGTR